MNSRCLVLETFTRPESALALQSLPVATPSAGQILIRTPFAPINPADLNVMEGTYGTLPPLPAVMGNESVGVVEACGPDVAGLKTGDLVLPLVGGLWSEFLTVPATQVVKLPQGIPLEQAAMLRVNPATAWLLLTKFISLRPNDWVVQNAANSAVGMAAAQLAQSQGWQVLNLVRRTDAIAPCKAAGAIHVLSEEDPNFKDQAAAIMGSNRARLALNAVGGESALRLANLLENGGTHVTYGAMSRQKLSLPNRFLIFQELTFTGFWLHRWLKCASAEDVTQLYQQLAERMVTGELQISVEKIYPVEEFTTAVIHAQQGKRGGKILLKW